MDVLKTETKNGKLITIKCGYHQLGYVNQLFSKFDKKDNFCIEFIEQEKCINYGYINKEK